jgi:hypothetical protein
MWSQSWHACAQPRGSCATSQQGRRHNAVAVLSQYVELGYATELLGYGTERVDYLLKDRVLDVGRTLLPSRSIPSSIRSMNVRSEAAGVGGDAHQPDDWRREARAANSPKNPASATIGFSNSSSSTRSLGPWMFA